ncbi:hypothetical protein [Acidocella facilis]|uniref:hypothetical protein n=1 Tax=Acidocella facilis TaxID=525 RepID=UPI0012DC9F9E|nr:hypothetical protein [Acidocella facilis]
MYKKQDFVSDLNSLQSRYERQMPGWYKKRAKPWAKEVEHAWALYCNARDNNLSMLVLGGIELRDDEDLLANMGTTAAAPMQNKSGNTTFNDRDSGSNRTGSVLKEKAWWPLQNDAWVLGGVQGLSQFHLAAGSVGGVVDDMLWEASARRPRVLGRELIGLFNFGYIRVRSPHEAKLGIVFAPHNAEAAKASTFKAYLAGITQVYAAANIRNMMDVNVPHASFTMPGR